MNFRKRALSVLLSAAMICNMGVSPVLAYAATGDTPIGASSIGASSVCEHHPTHTAECGYTEGTAGAPCTHTHTADCYSAELICGLTEEVVDSGSSSDAAHTHTQDCYKLVCTHVHDTACGYTEVTAGTPCTYECLICNPTSDKPLDSGTVSTPSDATKAVTRWQFVDPDKNLSENTLALPGVNAQMQASFDDVVALLPTALTGTVEGVAEPATVNITGWVCESYKTDEGGNWPISGTYTFVATLTEGYTATPAPTVMVELGGAKLLVSETGAFTVTGGTKDTDYSYASNTLTILKDTPLTISGTTTTDRIVVADTVTANVTLNGVSIDVNSIYQTCAFEIAGSATCNLTLSGDNTLKSNIESAGIQVLNYDGKTASLVITKESTGSLNATGGGKGAGIGGYVVMRGGFKRSSGNITINGGTIIATGTGNAGIGARADQPCGNIIINDGLITANGGIGEAGIDGGGSSVTINGGTVNANGTGYQESGVASPAIKGGAVDIHGGIITAISGNNSWSGTSDGISGTFTCDSTNGTTIIMSTGIADKTSQANWSGIIFENNAGKVYKDQTLTTNAEVPNGKTLEIPSGTTLTINDGVTLTNNGAIHNYGTIAGNGTIGGTPPINTAVVGAFTVTGGTKDADYSYAKNTLTIKSSTALTISTATPTTADKIVVQSGVTANITLDGVSIDVSTTRDACAFEIAGSATCNLTLSGDNTLKSGENKAGLQVQTKDSKTASLVIAKESTGSLNATGGQYSAGIGGGDNGAGGTTTINGGTVTATGGSYSAGIGGGCIGAGGTTTINGGTVIATGGNHGAGIGGGSSGSGGTIAINGGTVKASGNGSGAGIGGGTSGAGGIIKITGGMVTALGSGYYYMAPYYSAGIGGGDRGIGETIEITGGTVKAVGGYAEYQWDKWRGMGVGGGEGSDGGTFSTGTSGNAFIDTTGIADQSGKNNSNWGGIIFENNEGKVYKDQTLTTNAEVPSGKTLEIPNGIILTINNGVTLTNNGIINNNGTLTNNGTIVGAGTVNVPSSVAVSFSNAAPAYGDNITITATAQKKTGKGRLAAIGTVDFYLGDASTGTKLGTSSVTANGDTVTATLTMTTSVWETSGASWAIGSNIITADFGSAAGLQASAGTDTLTVSKATQTAPSTPSGTSKVTANTIILNAVSETGKGSLEYGYTVGGEITPGHWQADVNFTNLSPDTQYTFYTRFAGNEYYELKVSDAGKIVTTPAILTALPTDGLSLFDSEVAVKTGGTDKLIILHGTDTYLVVNSTEITISGGAGTTNCITIDGVAANITLNGVDIQINDKHGFGPGPGLDTCAFEMVGSATCNLTLKGNNTLKSSGGKAGLQVPTGATVTIDGTGTLNATGGEMGGAGIGGDDRGAGGTITINGGTVIATGGGWNGAGIGGTIIINGGTVIATGGDWGGAGIGGGAAGTFSTGINGNAFIIASSIAHQDNKANWNGVIFEGNSGKLYGTNISLSQNATIPTGKTLKIFQGEKLTIPASVTLQNNGTIMNLGTIVGNVTGTEPTVPSAIPQSLSVANGSIVVTKNGVDNLLIQQGQNYYIGANTSKLTFTGTTTADKIVVEDGVAANVTLDGVNIDVSATEDACAFEIAGNATCNLTLKDGTTNIFKSGKNKAGLQVQTGAELVIDGNGTLTATGGHDGAGIGSGIRGHLGKLIINSGTVNANGTNGAAGIGGGAYGNNGTVTINGGIINAVGTRGAGIGGGFRGAGGTTTINGGTVTATGDTGGAGIGGGIEGGAGGTATINGGTVTAIGDAGGTGIGGGDGGAAGTFSTGTSGNAFIIASSIADQKSQGLWNGVIFVGNTGKVYGTSVTLTTNATIPSGKTLEVETGKTLIVGTGVTLTNNGTITNSGTITNNGTIDGTGTISGTGSIIIGDNTITPPAGGTVTTDKDGKTELPGGSTIVNGDTTVTIGSGTSGGSIGKDGNITLPSGGEITVTDKNGNTSTIQVPTTGGDVTVKNDGTVTAPGGSTVTPPEGKPPVTVPEGGGTVGGDGGITGNSTVTSVAVSPATVSIQIGNTQQLTATVAGTNSPVQTVTWTSSHPAVATVSASGLVTAVANGTATITAVSTLDTSKSGTVAVTVTSPSSGGSTDNDNGGSSSGGTVVTPPAVQDNPTPPTTVETGVEVNTDKNGNATATVPDKDVTDAIEKAQKAAKKNDTEKNNIAIVLNVNVKENANSLEITLSEASITALRNAKAVPFMIKNGLTTMTFDLAALNALAGGEIKLTISKVDVNSLSAEAQKAIGNRPAFRFKATVGGKAITDFKGGRISLQMPYTHTATELSGNLCGVFVDTNGKVAWLENSSYDDLTSTLLTSTTHLSVYGIGYKENTPTFTDTAKHWAKNDIDFVVARGLLTGTGSTIFSPDQSMTGEILMMALGRLNANNIVNGTSATTFTPDKAITRQEMAVMLVNYSKSIGYKLPNVHAEIVFTDSANIGTWAKDAVKQTQMAGILMGKNGNKFDPTAIATRAEGSAMLHRFVELMVNTETAEGWTMNESGQWLYIENGKRITGEKTIDGKAYTFDRYGVTIALPPERKYLTYTVQKGDSFWSIARKYKISMLKLAEVNGKTISSVIHAGEELKIPD